MRMLLKVRTITILIFMFSAVLSGWITSNAGIISSGKACAFALAVFATSFIVLYVLYGSIGYKDPS